MRHSILPSSTWVGSLIWSILARVEFKRCESEKKLKIIEWAWTIWIVYRIQSGHSLEGKQEIKENHLHRKKVRK